MPTPRRTRLLRRPPLLLERLEERAVPAEVRWTNALGGNWAVPTNWSTGQVPGPADDAVIDLPGVTVTHSSSADTVRSLTTGDSTFVMGGGSLSLAAPSRITGPFQFTNGTLSGPGDLTIAGPFTW